VSLSWTAPVADGGTPVVGYTATCSDGTNSFENTGEASPVVVDGLTDGTTYSCTVVATNAAGESEASTSVLVVPYTVPAAPGPVTVSSGDGSLTVSFAAGASNGRPVTSYAVTCDDGVTLVTVTDDGSPVVVDGLTNGTPYSCSVTATNAAGVSQPSGEVPGTPAGPPSAPTGVSVLREGTTATVSYLAPDDDGGSAVVGYTAYCSSSDGSAPVDPVPSSGGAVETLTLTGLTEGGSYYCWVVARNAAGPSPAAS